MLLVTLWVQCYRGGAELLLFLEQKTFSYCFFFQKISGQLLQFLEMKNSAHCQHLSSIYYISSATTFIRHQQLKCSIYCQIDVAALEHGDPMTKAATKNYFHYQLVRQKLENSEKCRSLFPTVRGDIRCLVLSNSPKPPNTEFTMT